MSAIISDCGKYRYRLERQLGDEYGPTVGFIMVNPSKADAETDDATIRKCIGFAKTLGASEIIVGNKFAYRATDIKALRSTRDPIGPLNDQHIAQILYDSDIVIVAWGALSKLPGVLRDRWKDVVRLADAVKLQGPVDLMAIGTNADGHPRHPLMTGYDTPIERWTVPWFANRFRHKQEPPCSPLPSSKSSPT